MSTIFFYKSNITNHINGCENLVKNCVSPNLFHKYNINNKFFPKVIKKINFGRLNRQQNTKKSHMLFAFFFQFFSQRENLNLTQSG